MSRHRVETGAVALYKVLADGRRQVLGFAYAGDLIGLGAGGEHVMNAQAIKSTRVRCLPVSALRQSASNDPMLGFKLYEALARAGFLLAFSRRSARNGQDPAHFELPMTRSDIGDFLGLTIETVSRTFTKLKSLGLIALPQSNCVALLDIAELESLADGEDQNV